MSNDSGSAPDLLAELERVADRAGLVRTACTYRCHSGDVFGGAWRGVAVADLLEEADPRTTHLLAVSTDGYCVPISVVDALETVVALERTDDQADDDADGESSREPGAGLPRLVGDELDSSETVRDLAALIPVTLSGDVDLHPQHLAVDIQPDTEFSAPSLIARFEDRSGASMNTRIS